MMKSPTDWMPAVRHRRSQNAGVVYALVDEVIAGVDALMRISSRTCGECGSPAAKFFDNALARWCMADYWCEILRPEPERVNGSGHLVSSLFRNVPIFTSLEVSPFSDLLMLLGPPPERSPAPR